MPLKRKDLLTIRGLEVEEIQDILRTAESFKEVATREIKKVPALRGKTVVNLFYEPSTRTRTSFEIAAKRLSADVINISVGTSSVVKGETLLDTAKNIEAMRSDFIVLRHAMSGAPNILAKALRCSIINAGDGGHEHPTQALLDCFTLLERKGRIAGLRIAIVGDITHSRVARSNIYALKKLGADVLLCGPPTLIPADVDKLGVRVETDFDAAIEGVDAVMMLRVQMERHAGAMVPSIREYANLYCLTRERLKRADKEALVLHPGPINRGVEIAHDVADGLSSVILEQVTNGVAVRMAVLFLLSGGRGE